MTAHGKHRRSFWLGVGPVVILLMLLALALAPNAAAEYGGSRWKHTRVCVETGGIKTAAVRNAVKRSVAKWNSETVLYVRAKPDCSGYSQRVVVYDRYYDFKASGWVEFKGGYKWFYPKTTGPWTTAMGGTYSHLSPVIVRINRNYMTNSRWMQHTVSHELAHALGLGHTQKCAVVTQNKACSLKLYGGYWDYVGNATNPGINTLYAKG